MSRRGTRLDWSRAEVRCNADCTPRAQVTTKTAAVELAREHEESGCPWTFTVTVPIEVTA